MKPDHYANSLMRTALFLLVGATALTQPFQATQPIEGDWTIRTDKGPNFVLRIRNTSAVGFTGAYAGTDVCSATFADSMRFSLHWLNASSNIPGSNLTYFGTMAKDGRSITGTYGPSPNQSAGAWSAAFLQPAPPARTWPPQKGQLKRKPY